MLDAEYPDVRKGGVVDDRNFGGRAQDVVGALRAANNFDTAAGLINNEDKFGAVVLSKGSAEWVETQCVGSAHIKVLSHHKLVGDIITKQATPYRKAQNERIDAAIRSLRGISSSAADKSLRAYAAMTAGLTKALYGNVWALPSDAKVMQLTPAMLAATYSERGLMRCPETVLGKGGPHCCHNVPRADRLEARSVR